jgi:hypothetical protein
MRTRIVRTVGVAAAAAALALTAACGSAGSGSGSGSVGGTGSGAGHGSTAASGAGLTKADFGSSLQAAQKKAGSYTFVITTSTDGKSTKGAGEADVSQSTPRVHTTMDVAGSAIETIVTGGFYYMKAPMLHTAKPWLKIDPNAKTGMGALVGQLGGNSDPSKSLGAMFGASKVTKVGSENVAGVATTHYTVVLPRSALASAMKYPEQIINLLPKSLTYDTWVDGADLVRKVTSNLTVQGHRTTTEISFDHYGDKVNIAAPPASQTTTTSALG